jgi:hypothetical protein
VTKTSALGDSLFVGSTDISGDVGSLGGINVTRALLDVTAINKSAMERILGRADGEISFTSFWNTGTGARSVLNTVGTAAGTADIIASFADGSTVGNPAASIKGKQIDFVPTVGADGSIAVTTTVRGNGSAVEWGVQQSAGSASFAGTAVGGTVDGGASNATGGAAYLHLFSIGGGTATFSIQDSSDGSTGWADVTGLVFTAASAVTAERVATSATATVKRYTRVQCSNPGGGTAVAFVNFCRNA